MKKSLCILICFFTVFMSGCWDKVEIDQNFFVSTIGIDVGKDIKNDKLIKEAKPDEPFGERKIERLSVTYAFPDISKYSTQSPQIPSDKFINTKAYSMEDAMSNAFAKSSRNPSLGHMELLMLSSEFLENKGAVKEAIDYMSRNPKINRRVYVVAVKGKAEEFIKFKVQMENTIGTYVKGLMESSKKNASILPITLNEFLILLSQNGNAIIPALEIDKDKNEMIISGIAIIKDYVVQGYLTPQDTSAVEMLRGKLKSGKKVIYKEEHPIDIEIDGLKRKIKTSEKDGKLIFDIDINIEAKIKEYVVDKNLFNKDVIDEIENLFSSSLSEEGEKVSRFIQREYGVDIIGLREYVEKYMPDTWRRIKNDWEMSFRSAEINVDANVEIRRIGVRK